MSREDREEIERIDAMMRRLGECSRPSPAYLYLAQHRHQTTRLNTNPTSIVIK